MSAPTCDKCRQTSSVFRCITCYADYCASCCPKRSMCGICLTYMCGGKENCTPHSCATCKVVLCGECAVDTPAKDKITCEDCSYLD